MKFKDERQMKPGIRQSFLVLPSTLKLKQKNALKQLKTLLKWSLTETADA